MNKYSYEQRANELYGLKSEVLTEILSRTRR